MKRTIGIGLFIVVAAVSFYLHFNKVAHTYMTMRVDTGKVVEGRSHATVNGDLCSQLARYEGRFVGITGTVKRVKGNKVELGCLLIVIHTAEKPRLEEGDRIYAEGFIKSDRGMFYVDIWDENNLRKR